MIWIELPIILLTMNMNMPSLMTPSVLATHLQISSSFSDKPAIFVFDVADAEALEDLSHPQGYGIAVEESSQGFAHWSRPVQQAHPAVLDLSSIDNPDPT